MAFDQLLRRRQNWDCAYALDLTDVRVLALPPCAALGGALVVASDDATDEASIKKWLRYKANATNFNQVWSEQARSFFHHGPGPLHKSRTRLELRGGQSVRAPALWHLHPPTPCDRRIWNCGVVGGPRHVFGPALTNVAERMLAHWARWPDLTSPGLDMLLWNDVALERHLRDPKSVITGFPWGLANLPVNQVGLWSRCAGVCLLGMLNLTRGTFWFVHKPVFAWTILHRAWDHCEPPAEASWEPTETVVKMERGMNVTPRVVRAGVPEGLLFFGLDTKSQ